MVGNFGIRNMEEDEIYDFVNLSTEEQKNQMIKTILEEIEIVETSLTNNESQEHHYEFEMIGGRWQRKAYKQKDKIVEIVKAILETCDIGEWDQKINEIGKSAKADINLGAYQLRKLAKESKLVRKNPAIISTLYRWKESFTQSNPTYNVPFYHGSFLLYFLRDLDKIYNLRTLEKEFAEYSEEVAHNFFSLTRNFMHYVDGEKKEAIYRRSKEIFLLKIAKLSLPEQQAIIEEFPEFTNYRNNPIALALEGQYQNIPRFIRGITMYIVEGGEILNEKGFDEANIELPEYQAQISLSVLVQAKKDNEQYFQGFSGTPAELVAHSRESQKGVDPSKAMRDIMHSTENQIVNDGYLWIREVLQNSLDAVKQTKDQFAETPKVSVDTHLRKKFKEIPENELWDVLRSAITRYYPYHFDYFRSAIARTVPTLKTEDFSSAIEALGALTGENVNYFPDSLIHELKTEL